MKIHYRNLTAWLSNSIFNESYGYSKCGKKYDLKYLTTDIHLISCQKCLISLLADNNENRKQIDKFGKQIQNRLQEVYNGFR